MKADLCWLVGRVARISWFITGQLTPVRVETGELGFHTKGKKYACTMHARTCNVTCETAEGFFTRDHIRFVVVK